jgi:hypothetical protein
MRRLLLATLILLLGADGAAAKDVAAAYPQSLTFAVSRKGEAIGTHSMRFIDEGDRRTVTTTIDLAVKAAGLNIYRYVHNSRETWQGERLQSLNSQTDDNGTLYKVRINRDGEMLRVDREARKPVIKSIAFDQWMPAETSSASETLPGNMMPTSLWHPRLTSQSVLINTQFGTSSRFQVSKIGRESIRTRSGSIEATRYRYAGEIRFDQWFDDRGRWVKASFTAPDGSIIDYTLQE